MPIDIDSPIEHTCRNGVVFKSATADLRYGVVYDCDACVSDEAFAAACAQFGAWHAMEVGPRLNGFSGYGALRLIPAS